MKLSGTQWRAVSWILIAVTGLLYVALQVRRRGWDPLLVLIVLFAIALVVLSSRYLIRTLAARPRK